MNFLVRSNIIDISPRENVILNLNLPSIPNTTNVLCGTICNICTNCYISNVTVTLKHLKSNTFFNTLSNKFGEYMFFSLPLGAYFIEFKLGNLIIAGDYIEIDKRINNWYNVTTRL